MQRVKFAVKYLKHLWKANTRHGTHSPFVYQLLDEVIYEDKPFYAFDEIEKLRNQLLMDERKINITDYGAGSHVNQSKTRKVSDIAKHSAKTPKFGRLMFRLVNYFQPQTLVELGTSLGLSTAYQASAVKKAQMITLEGCPETAKIALENFKQLELENIQLTEGNFDDTLPKALRDIPQLDWAFFDGNHRKEPTLNYFHQCLEKASEKSVFIFDDIHWSDGMESAWREIQNHPKVTITLDLFFVGLVFFRKMQAKEHFIIRL